MALAFGGTAAPAAMPLFIGNLSQPVAQLEPYVRIPMALQNTTQPRVPIRKEQIVRPNILPSKPIFKDDEFTLAKSLREKYDSAKSFFSGILGTNPECMNQGRWVGQGCVCPYGFNGTRCEEIICENAGVSHRVEKLKPPESICKCPDPEYISGKHCQNVNCMHQGNWSREMGRCFCDDQWYYGKFCENQRMHLPFLIGIPVCAILVVLLLCYICKIDWCPRRHPRHARNRRDYGHREEFGRRRMNQPGNRLSRSRQATGLLVQEQLLGEERGAPMRGPAYPPGIVPPYVIRLDTIPTFNPQMLGGVDPSGAGINTLEMIKEIEPPPSYDQAMAAPRPPAYNQQMSQSSNMSSRTTNSASTEQPPPPPSSTTPTPPITAPPRGPPQMGERNVSSSSSASSNSSAGPPPPGGRRSRQK